MLPATRMLPSSLRRRLAASATPSPRRMVELSQSASASVEDTTYLGMPFIFAAKPTSSVIVGHAFAKPS